MYTYIPSYQVTTHTKRKNRCDVLDRMDEALETAMHENPSLLLIKPADHQKPPAVVNASASGVAVEAGGTDGGGGGASGVGSDGKAEEVVLCCLRFLAILMRNCVNKHVFSSSEVREEVWVWGSVDCL